MKNTVHGREGNMVLQQCLPAPDGTKHTQQTHAS
jgi:hypothetical protein